MAEIFQTTYSGNVEWLSMECHPHGLVPIFPFCFPLHPPCVSLVWSCPMLSLGTVIIGMTHTNQHGIPIYKETPKTENFPYHRLSYRIQDIDSQYMFSEVWSLARNYDCYRFLHKIAHHMMTSCHGIAVYITGPFVRGIHWWISLTKGQ